MKSDQNLVEYYSNNIQTKSKKRGEGNYLKSERQFIKSEEDKSNNALGGSDYAGSVNSGDNSNSKKNYGKNKNNEKGRKKYTPDHLTEDDVWNMATNENGYQKHYEKENADYEEHQNEQREKNRNSIPEKSKKIITKEKDLEFRKKKSEEILKDKVVVSVGVKYFFKNY